jgi:hypothetical protein
MKKNFKPNNISSIIPKNYLTSAFSGGIFGFFLFFLIIIVVKTISYLLGTLGQFKIESEDILLSVIGLVLMSLIKVLEGLRLKEHLP